MPDQNKPERQKKERIVVLGGGVSAMTAVWHLTEVADWQDKYDITVYQQGWRLGGKGASGRNAQRGQRIEEHGLHIWFGFYVNAFKMIQDVYRAARRPEGTPLARWDDAFKPHSYVVIEEHWKGVWKNWPFDFPVRDYENPADGTESPSAWDILKLLLSWLAEEWQKSEAREREALARTERDAPEDDSLWGRFWAHVEREEQGALEHVADWVEQRGVDLLDELCRITDDMDALAASNTHYQGQLLLGLLEAARAWLGQRLEGQLDSDADRRMWIVADLSLTTLIGAIQDHVTDQDDWTLIDDLDVTDWYRKHGASEVALQSAIVIGMYDLIFGYEDGKTPNYAAGTAVLTSLRILLDYKKAFMWKMQAGMGDTIFAPMYQVLAERGVTFKFFHAVQSLHPARDEAGQPVVGQVRIAQQAQLKDGAHTYQPLLDVKGLACWPSEPRYEQLLQGDLLQQHRIDLESFWSDWGSYYRQPELVLERGRDFDRVVLGIPVASHPFLCGELLALSPRWKTMTTEIKTVVTQAFQLWLDRDLKQLGWEAPSPVLSCFTEPLDTWADMSHLIDREDWPPSVSVRNIAYFCGAMPCTAEIPAADPDYRPAMYAQAKANAIALLEQDMHWLWRGWGQAAQDNGRWDWLIDEQGRSGVGRFDAQYWRANADPSERYTLSVAGSTRYRLRADESGFANLVFAGDWMLNGINIGCVEASVMCGMHASRAISGYPLHIVGDKT